MNSNDEALVQRIRRDLVDSYDEELELELEDRNLDTLDDSALDVSSAQYKEDRRQYFRELFRMQAELVKLQDWVVNTGHKVVILFEGRDAAGKGGVIKRITQRLNPRVCRVAWSSGAGAGWGGPVPRRGCQPAAMARRGWNRWQRQSGTFLWLFLL